MDSIEYLSRCYREIVPSKKISLMVELDAGANSLHEELRICPRDGTSVPNQASVGFPSRPKLVDAKELPKRALSTDEGRGAFFHAICHIEFTAINLAIDAALRFSAMPFDYYRDWLQIAKEEAIHFGLLRDHLNALGYDYGDFDAHDGMWQLAQRTADDVILRMALIPRVLEARGLDVTPPMIKRLTDIGDKPGAAILERIYNDEISHVAAGSRWFIYACEDQNLNPEDEFTRIVTAEFGQLRANKLNLEGRSLAGFSQRELERLMDDG